MKKITFDELHKLVSKIDYINEKSFPIVVSTKDGSIRDDWKFEFGLANPFVCCDKEFEEQQYLNLYFDDSEVTMYLKDSDCMTFKEIGEMLRKYVVKKDDCEIFLHDEDSFTGEYKDIVDIPSEFEASLIEEETQGDVCEEVAKGIEWFKKALDEDIVLFGDIDGSILNLNEMNGSDFAWFFESREKMYYNTITCTLTKRCPSDFRSNKTFFKTIESNDRFKWILLYICKNEDYLSGIKSCNVKVVDYLTNKVKEINCINEEKINKTIKEIYEKVASQI